MKLPVQNLWKGAGKFEKDIQLAFSGTLKYFFQATF